MEYGLQLLRELRELQLELSELLLELSNRKVCTAQWLDIQLLLMIIVILEGLCNIAALIGHASDGGIHVVCTWWWSSHDCLMIML